MAQRTTRAGRAPGPRRIALLGLAVAVALAAGGCSGGGEDPVDEPSASRTSAAASSSEPPTSGPGATTTALAAEPGVSPAEVWVATESGLLVRVDVRAGRVVQRLDAGGAAHNVAALPDGRPAAASW